MTWSGFSGAPGYTNLHFLDPDEITETGANETSVRNRAFWQAISVYLPIGVTVTMPAFLEHIDTGSGELIAEVPWAQGAAVNGSSSSNYSSATGGCITWRTVGVVNGRKLRGRTFLVPLGNGTFDTNGTLLAAVVTGMTTAGNNLANATTGIDLAVWHRPAPGGTDGIAAGVTSCSVTDKTAVLRSRRD